MSGINQKILGNEKEYDRKVDALWEEKRKLIMSIVGVIEGMGKLTAAHREHMKGIEAGLEDKIDGLNHTYWADVHTLRLRAERDSDEEKAEFKRRWDQLSEHLEGLNGIFRGLVDKERDLWFGEEFTRAVKRMKISEGMFEEGIDASIKKAFLAPEGEGGGGSSGGTQTSVDVSRSKGKPLPHVE